MGAPSVPIPIGHPQPVSLALRRPRLGHVQPAQIGDAEQGGQIEIRCQGLGGRLGGDGEPVGGQSPGQRGRPGCR